VEAFIIRLTNNFNNSLNNNAKGILGTAEEDFGCFPKNILKAIESKQGSLTVNVCFQSKEFGPNGTYNPKTKTIGYINSYVDDMTTLHD